MFVINNGTYPFDVLFCLGVSHEEICKKLKSLGTILSEEQKEKLWMKGLGRTVMFENNATVIRIDNIKNKAHFHANISHEVFHAVEFLFERIGLEYTVVGGEAFAYQIQHLTKQIYDKLS